MDNGGVSSGPEAAALENVGRTVAQFSHGHRGIII